MKAAQHLGRGGAKRRTRAAGPFVVVAVSAGALVGCGGVSGGPPAQTVTPPAATLTATPSSEQLPASRTLNATAFNDATDGWTSGWTEGPSPVSTDLPCVPYKGALPEPIDSSTREFRSGPRIGATHQVERFDTSTEANDSLVSRAYSESCQGEGSELPDEIWTGGQSVNFGHRLDGQRFYEFWVVHEAELAVLRVAGAGELPEPVRKRVVAALLADLRT